MKAVIGRKLGDAINFELVEGTRKIYREGKLIEYKNLSQIGEIAVDALLDELYDYGTRAIARNNQWYIMVERGQYRIEQMIIPERFVWLKRTTDAFHINNANRLSVHELDHSYQITGSEYGCHDGRVTVGEIHSRLELPIITNFTQLDARYSVI